MDSRRLLVYSRPYARRTQNWQTCLVAASEFSELISQAEESCTNREDVEYSDVIIFSHGHFSRVFIARWCGFPLSAGYNFQADAGGVNILGYQHMSLEEPCESAGIP